MLEKPDLFDPALFNIEKLEAWMDGQGIESGPIVDAIPLGGGTQNVIVRFRRGKSEFVLRRPSAHPRGNSNQTMLREAQVLGALAGTNVPHPALIAACADTEVLGSTFYLMQPIDGFFAPGELPEPHRSDPAIRHRMGLALVEGAAMLGAVDYLKVGLEGFGKPDQFLERQTGRWASQLESYKEHEAWPGPAAIPGFDTVRRWLEDNIPSAGYRPGIIHGDYHIANVLFRHDSGDLAAIIDWELATIGDPLLDLGWILATWPDENGEMPDPGIAVLPWNGFAKPAELIEHYARHSTRDLSAVSWYAVLACYKLGIILEGTYARACVGKAPKETGDRLHHSTIGLFKRALYWIERS